MDYMEYYSLKMVDWVIIIDLYQNFNYMKRILRKSTENQRMEITDEVKSKGVHKILLNSQCHAEARGSRTLLIPIPTNRGDRCE